MFALKKDVSRGKTMRLRKKVLDALQGHMDAFLDGYILEGRLRGVCDGMTEWSKQTKYPFVLRVMNVEWDYVEVELWFDSDSNHIYYATYRSGYYV